MLFNVFLERIMADALDGHVGLSVIQLTYLRFADDIDRLASSETEIPQLVSRLERASKNYGMGISRKTKLMMNNNNGMTTDIQIARNTLDEVQSFKFLDAIIGEEGPKSEVLARIAQTTAALSSRKIV